MISDPTLKKKKIQKNTKKYKKKKANPHETFFRNTIYC